MPVIPYSSSIFSDRQKLSNLLSNEVEEVGEKERTTIISFSQKINCVDPLAFLQKMGLKDRIHFYWENPAKQEAIAACDTVKFITINTTDRFIAAHKFIKSCLKQIIRTGDTDIPGAGPHFFCSFTFFPPSSNRDFPFPGATIFLPKIQIYRQHDRCVLVYNVAVNKEINVNNFSKKLKQEIKEIDWSGFNLLDFNCHENRDLELQNLTKTDTSNEFKLAVSSALKSINKNEFTKIVIAHAIDVNSSVPFQIIESLNNLRKLHRDCYIFSTGNGKGHTFIGASPERLISIQNKQLVTDALAGSAPRGRNTSEDIKLANQLLKNRKEKREHEAVSDFITQRLIQLGLTPQKLPLQLLQLSNIQHLWTPIYAHLPVNLHPLEIVCQLHPTPAVAGVPSDIALERIRRYECFDRSLYAAPLGWIDYQGNAEFIVGIRSALIENNNARLYAGAGIVSGSDPEKEFAEIQLKLQSLLKALV
jgi:menaquinone-specific isochorismate synthase